MLLTKFVGNRSKYDRARMKRGTVTQNVKMLPEERKKNAKETEQDGNFWPSCKKGKKNTLTRKKRTEKNTQEQKKESE